MNDQITYTFIYKLIIKLLEFYWDFLYHFGLQLTKHAFKNNSKAKFQESIALLLTMVISKNMFFSQFSPNLVNKHNYPTLFINKENSRIKNIHIISYSLSTKYRYTMVLSYYWQSYNA